MDEIFAREMAKALKQAKPNLSATEAADIIEQVEQAGAPRAQIDAARAATGRELRYIPHQGAREIARRLKREAQRA